MFSKFFGGGYDHDRMLLKVLLSAWAMVQKRVDDF